MSDRKINVRITSAIDQSCMSIIVYSQDGNSISSGEVLEVLQNYIAKLAEATSEVSSGAV